MNRGASSLVLTEIAKSANSPVHLIEIYLDGATLCGTDAYKPMTWGGNTYDAAGALISFDGLEETDGLDITQTRVTLSGVSQTSIAALLLYAYIDRRLVIRLGFLDSSEALVADPVVIFDGRIDSSGITENPSGGSCSLSVTASAHWIDFERKPGRHTNHEEQQIHFPGDTGFEYVSQLTKIIKWGKA